MVNRAIPEVFYKDRFCKAVCGFTDQELREKARSCINEIDGSVGRDMPRAKDEEILDHIQMFMGSNFRFNLLPLPLQELYESFAKFRAWEEHVHPRPDFSSYEKVYGPIYQRIETAHRRADEGSLREGILDLVDLMVHD